MENYINVKNSHTPQVFQVNYAIGNKLRNSISLMAMFSNCQRKRWQANVLHAMAKLSDGLGKSL